MDNFCLLWWKGQPEFRNHLSISQLDLEKDWTLMDGHLSTSYTNTFTILGEPKQKHYIFSRYVPIAITFPICNKLRSKENSQEFSYIIHLSFIFITMDCEKNKETKSLDCNLLILMLSSVGLLWLWLWCNYWGKSYVSIFDKTHKFEYPCTSRGFSTYSSLPFSAEVIFFD